MSVPWELNPQPFALLTQCSTTELQKHSMVNSIQRTVDSVLLYHRRLLVSVTGNYQYS